jgi:hypothetical protein
MPDGSDVRPLFDLAIFKNTIHFRRAEEIENDLAHDPDAPAVGMGKVKRPLTDYGKSKKPKKG